MLLLAVLLLRLCIWFGLVMWFGLLFSCFLCFDCVLMLLICGSIIVVLRLLCVFVCYILFAFAWLLVDFIV